MTTIYENSYDIGEVVRLGLTVKVAGVLTDPTTLTATVKDPSGTVTTYIYGTDSALVKISTGTFHLDVDATAAGTWNVRLASTGNGKGAEQGAFYVNPSNV